jgi:hypothetical protein
MSPAQETQSMREIRLLRGRLPHKGGGLTGMDTTCLVWSVLLVEETGENQTCCIHTC